MAFSTSPVHETTATYSTGTSVVVTVSAPANNNLVVAHYAGAQNTVTVTSISQTNVTWGGSADAATHVNRDTEIWSGIASASAGTTCTINLSTTTTLAGVNITEWSGNDTGTFRDAHGTNSGNSTTPTTATITPTSGKEVLFVFGARTPANYSSGPTGITGAATGPIRLSAPDTRTETGFAIVLNTSGSYSATWTVASSNGWDATIAAYLAPGGGGSGASLLGKSTVADHYFDETDSFDYATAVVITGASPGIIPASRLAKTLPSWENQNVATEEINAMLLFNSMYGVRATGKPTRGSTPSVVTLALQRPGDSASS